MKEILLSIVNHLFDKIPFSKKEEELKKEISTRLLQKYEDDLAQKDQIKNVGELISGCNSIQSACDTVGYEKEDIEQYLDTDGVKNRADAKKMIKRSKRYIYVQSFCLVEVIRSILWILCNFSLGVILFRGIMIAAYGGLFIWASKSKKNYLSQCGYEALRYDESGREYLYQLNDKYTKKFINTSLTSIGIVAYVIFSLLLSVLYSKYTLLDVAKQLVFMSFVLEVFLFLHLKNYICKRQTDVYFVEDRREQVKTHLLKLSGISGIYFVAAIAIYLVFRNKIEYSFNWILVVEALYSVGCLVYNLTYRKQLVFKNIVVNVKRVVCISMVAVILITYNVMSMDFYLTQPYINTVSKVLEEEDQIEYDDETGVYTITTEKENFKILQLTDIHLGGSVVSLSSDLKALKACYELIEYTKPDFVVVTGDMVFPMGVMSFSLNNRAPIMQFANFMRNTGIPWAFTYGNHDTESMATLNDYEFDDLMKSLSFRSSANLLYPYSQPDIYGRSNQMIEVRNTDGSLMQALFLIDSNDYIAGSGKINEYDYIHDDQVEWYKQNVVSLSEKEGYTIPSMVFFHIPLQEYKEANDLYESGSDQVTYYYGILGETMINKICCSDYESKLFDTAVELGSTKAMFCGHDHYNNQSLEYKGIRLTYGYSIDYLVMPGIKEDTEQRGATLITIEKDGEFEINPYRLIDIQNNK